jgi:diguanylate cyclase (GGDEF)-like protein/PAS domain S-box-containing protein
MRHESSEDLRRRLEEALAQTRGLVEHAPVGIALYAEDGRCVEGNPALAKMVGASRAELLAQNFRELESWQRSGLASHAEMALASGEVTSFETWLTTTFGVSICLQARFVPLEIGGSRRLMLLASDVSSERRREQALQDRERRLVELNRLAAELTALTEPSGLLQTAVDHARELVDAHLGVIVRMDPVTGRPALVYPSNYPMGRVPPGVVIQGAGLLGRLARGERLFTVDARAEPGYRGLPAWHPDIGPLLGEPVLDGDKVVAMLLVGRPPGARPFSDEDRELVDTVASLVAVALRVSEQFEALNALNRKLEELATTDALTGLGNRRAFDEHIATNHSRAQRYRDPYGVLLADVDHFKRYNDRYGHPAGDRILAALGQLVRRALRLEDGTFRYGGEEIVMLLPNQRAAGLAVAAERLRAMVEAAAWPHADSDPGVVTLSLGGAVFDPARDSHRGRSWQDVVQLADGALYEAKRAGRNRAVLADG